MKKEEQYINYGLNIRINCHASKDKISVSLKILERLISRGDSDHHSYASSLYFLKLKSNGNRSKSKSISKWT